MSIVCYMSWRILQTWFYTVVVVVVVVVMVASVAVIGS